MQIALNLELINFALLHHHLFQIQLTRKKKYIEVVE